MRERRGLVDTIDSLLYQAFLTQEEQFETGTEQVQELDEESLEFLTQGGHPLLKKLNSVQSEEELLEFLEYLYQEAKEVLLEVFRYVERG